MLKNAGVIVVRPLNLVDEGFPIDEACGDEVDSMVVAETGSEKQSKALEQKL
jgi:hypothetical protein